MSFNKIDLSGIKVERVSELKAGRGKFVHLVGGDGQKICFQTPVMPISFDVKVRSQESGGTSCSLSLSFGTADPKVAAFREFLGRLRARVAEVIAADSKKHIGKDLNVAAVDKILSDLVKPPPENTTYADSFLAKLEHSRSDDGEDVINVKVFDAAEKAIGADVLRRGVRAAALVTIPYVHIGNLTRPNGMMTIKSECSQILALPVQNQAKFGFDLDGDDELRTAAESIRASEAAGVKRARSDDDEYEHADEAPPAKKQEQEKALVFAETDAADDV